MEQNFETCLYNVVDAAKIQKDEPMKKHTTFRIGGPADYFIMPSNEKELAETIRVCRGFSIPIYSRKWKQPSGWRQRLQRSDYPAL